MLNQSYTAVIERAQPLSGEFESEPYEAGWAREALVFLKVREGLSDGGEIQARIQISPDGIDWVDEGAVLPAVRDGELSFAKVTNFGNWLRVAGQVDDQAAVARASIYIALKE